jgi:hypothetical protein
MGFSLTLMIYSAKVYDDVQPGLTLWYPEEIIRCGYINRRIQGVVEGDQVIPNIHLHHPEDIAGTALISLIFKRFPSYARVEGSAVYAPPFLLEGEYRNIDDMRAFYEGAYEEKQNAWLLHLKAGEHRLVPKGFGSPAYEVWPDLIVQSKHNAGHTQGKASEPDLLRGEPNRFVPCSELASWLASFWSLESTSRLVLEQNVRARVRLQSWQAQLTAYGAIGSKVLFVFRHCPERF